MPRFICTPLTTILAPRNMLTTRARPDLSISIGTTAASAAEWVRSVGFTLNPSDMEALARQVGEKTLLSRTGGAPPLSTGAEYLAWARVMSREFEALRKADKTGTPSLLDSYGATNPAEFFAVVTEAFFERPRAMRAKQPALYAQLAAFYRQDPASYSAEAAR